MGIGAFEIAVSVPLVLEYESALLRHAAKTGLGEDDIGDLLDYLCSIATHQKIFYLWRPFLRDPGDDLVLEAAVAGRCEAVITHNVKDFRGVEEFGVHILTPGEFLKLLRSRKWEP